MELSKDERKMIAGVLLRHVDDLNKYIGWISDHPRLPDREVAIGNVMEEVRVARQLALKLMDHEQK